VYIVSIEILKPIIMANVSTYLNFPGNALEVFNFYKTVFGGEFSGGGVARFGDFPPTDSQPPLPEDVKEMVLHIELPIMGGHILMGSDAPESLGFKVETGNNIFINIEPGSREETKRLFTLLSEGGKITMPLQDMFWGAYYGSCTDKYGIQWMFNCTEK
jgi:PhnB protein